MMKKLRSALALILALTLLVMPAGAEGGEEEDFDPDEWAAVETLSSLDDVSASVGAAVLMERETRTCLYESEARKHLPIASVTKVMTLLLVTEAVDRGDLRLDQKVTCSAYAASMGGSQIFLEEGETMTAEELIKAVAVSSANDGAVALAEAAEGSEGAFVERMNQRARELGMEDTVYANCTGLPCQEEHYSCAWDIAVLSCQLLSCEWIRKYTTIWTDTVRNGNFGLSNTNKLIRFYPGATGLKTGFTQEAMYCLSASAMRDGTEYVAVILHAPSSDIRFESAKLLLNHAFANYRLIELLPDAALPPVAVRMGASRWVQPAVSGQTKLLLEKRQIAGLRKELVLAEEAEAPVEAGQQLGYLRLLDAEGRELARAELTAEATILRASWGNVLRRLLRFLFLGGE
ncbi:MAG: D-alanyl-D-alanine carboxypeptidase [Oscillospiraceae bacterium]|nr:D-alanyl-D-alanine carboxypeptidase [Oscillospiraceae bacterium]